MGCSCQDYDASKKNSGSLRQLLSKQLSATDLDRVKEDVQDFTVYSSVAHRSEERKKAVDGKLCRYSQVRTPN